MRNHCFHMLPQNFPTATIVVKSEQSDEALDVVVNECMVEFWERFLQGFRCDAMTGKKLKIHTS